jgi:long-chain acyl-CoA synthetase
VLHLLRAHLLGRFPELAEELAASGGFSVWRRWWRFRRVHRALGLKFWAFLCGGASLPADLERFWTTLGFALIQGYGMTETAALVTLNHPFRTSRGSIGKALPGRELRLENGEILVRGDMLSAATWQGGAMKPREEGWFATGDLAEQNQEGELRFVGRKDDVIVTASGMNIHPSDLESAVENKKGVRGCVVVSCHIAGGSEPVAVVLLSGSDGELQAVIRAANEQLADFQQIRRFLRWPEPGFPYTSTGKLLRRKVSDWACATLASGRPSADRITGSEKDALLEVIALVTGETIPRGDDGRRLTEELHLDSIARVQLQSALEQKFAIEIPDDAMAEVETLGELRALAEHASGDDPKPLLSDAARHAATEQSEPQATTDAPRGEAREHASPLTDEHVYPHWPWAAPIRFVRVLFMEIVLRPLVWLLAAPRVVWDFTGLPAGPFLLIANHITAYDGALILYALPTRLRRRVAVAMSGEMLLDLRKGRGQGSYWKNAAGPLAYWLLTGLFNTFPLPRLRGFRRSFIHAGQALDRGDSVLIFPEGHRSPDGRLQPFRPGIGMLAHDSQVQVLPIALIGLEEMRASRHWFRSGRLCIRIGDPIAIEEAMEPAALTLRLEEAVGRLAGQPASV